MKKSQKNKKFSHFLQAILYTFMASVFILAVAKYIFGKQIDIFPKETPEPLFETQQNLDVCEVTEPVCAENGITYNNVCQAKKSGVKNFSFGKCEPQPENTKISDTKSTMCDGQKISPVCGTDGKTYNNACLAREAGVVIASYVECIQENTTENSQKNQENNQTSENISASGSVAEFDPSKYHIYHNKTFGYSYALPNYSYYQGFAGQNGADSVMAVGLTESGVADFATADVQIYFYKNRPAVVPTQTALSLSDASVIYISGKSENPKIQKILETLQESASISQ